MSRVSFSGKELNTRLIYIYGYSHSSSRARRRSCTSFSVAGRMAGLFW